MAVSDDQLHDFFEKSRRCFAVAAAAQGQRSFDYRLAERQLRLKFAGDQLVHLTRPLDHLACLPALGSSAPPNLEIEVWSGDGQFQPPTPPWDFQQLHWFGEIADLGSQEFAVNFSADHGLLMMFHRPTGRAIFWLPDAADLPFWEIAAPFRVLFHWWSRTFGAHVAHAAAIGQEGQGILLVGRGGSGKSTTSIACVDSGMEYVGDDYVLLVRSPQPTAHSLYQSAKIHTRFLHRSLAHWSDWVAAEIGPEGKSLLFLNEHLPHQVRSKLVIHGVVRPRVTPSPHATIAAQPAAQGLLAIAPSTMYQLPEARQATLSFFAEWTRVVPSYLLNLGTDLASAPNLLAQHLAMKGARRAA